MHDALVSLLSSVGLTTSGAYGDYLKFVCPFHDNASGKTLWVERTSGHWGCWSTRCPQHKGGRLEWLLYNRGVPTWQARQLAEACDLTQQVNDGAANGLVEQKDIDDLGLVTKAHLGLWRVEWELANDVLKAVARSGRAGECSGMPVSTWADVLVQPGTVEHDYWNYHWYWLGHRGMPPESLALMDVGFDLQQRVYTLPIYTPEGKLVGVARRQAKDGAKYYVNASAYGYAEPGYKYVHVDRRGCLWGWWEQRERIAAGDPIVVVEGYADALRLIGCGFVAVAKMGKKLTKEQVSLLLSVPNKKVLWADNDWDGLTAGYDDVVSVNASGTEVVTCFWDQKDAADTPPFFVKCAVQLAGSRSDFFNQFIDLRCRAQMLEETKAARAKGLPPPKYIGVTNPYA